MFPFEGEDLSIQNSFLDLIVLDDIFKYGNLKACFFKDSELKEINPIYESFKRVKYVNCRNNEDGFASINTLKQAPILEIEKIGFGEMKAEDFEQITNQLLKYKIHTLNYGFRWESISNQVLENISKINLQKLYQLILNIWNLF